MKILYQPHCYSQQRQREKKVNIYPILMAMEATKRRNEGEEVCWGTPQGRYDKIITEPEGLSFLSLPHADRILTKAFDPAYQQNGNFKYHPGTYIQSANGCWHGKCTFCVENGKPYEVRDIWDVLDELYECKQLGFKEIFDDSATFPIGEWLEKFCFGVHSLKLKLGCNMRMVDVDYEMMKEAGFRMLLFGLESANEKTLEKINKGIKTNDIKYIIKAEKAGLEPHVSGMIGFPWESYEDTMRTINLIKWLLIKGYVKTAQMSFYTPPKGQEQGIEKYKKYVTKFYEVGFNPIFWWNKILNIKSKEDLNYLIKGIQRGFSALLTKKLT